MKAAASREPVDDDGRRSRSPDLPPGRIADRACRTVRADRTPGALPVTVVVLTRNRCAELHGTLRRLSALPERPPVIVVDNGSTDGTAAAVRASFPQVQLVPAGTNLGAAGRTIGVALARTPYIAFCDDDAWWAPGSLARAVAVLDAHPSLGALNARVLVGEENRLDPTCRLMAASPLRPRPGQPGPRLIGLLASATVVRRTVFLELGGFHRCFGVGGEEQLLVLDLLSTGRDVCYAPDLVVHHHPSQSERDHDGRRCTVVRNRLWTAWMRYPAGEAVRRTAQELRAAVLSPGGVRGVAAALRGLPWVWRERRVVPSAVVELVRRVEEAVGPVAP